MAVRSLRTCSYARTYRTRRPNPAPFPPSWLSCSVPTTRALLAVAAGGVQHRVLMRSWVRMQLQPASSFMESNFGSEMQAGTVVQVISALGMCVRARARTHTHTHTHKHAHVAHEEGEMHGGSERARGERMREPDREREQESACATHTGTNSHTCSHARTHAPARTRTRTPPMNVRAHTHVHTRGRIRTHALTDVWQWAY
jgi:hypothetical protein